MANGNNKLAKLQDKLDGLMARNKGLRDKLSAGAESSMRTGAIIGGGALAGYLTGEYPDKTVGGLHVSTIGGVAMVAVGLTGLGGKQSAMIGNIGEGMLAYEVGRRVAEKAKG